MPQARAKIGVIGGSGLYDMEGLTGIQELAIDTPFGKPSDKIVVGQLEGVGVAFLPRHARGHRILPSGVPYKANIYALKSLGVEHIISVNACGSYKQSIAPGHIVIPDQIIDRTQNRVNTFFDAGIVVHISFSNPFCPALNQILYRASIECGATTHQGGTYIAMEGPAFSTRAESRLYKSWGADIVNMTVIPEAKLAREAEICYSSIAHVTDYDSWMETGETVTTETILNILKRSIETTRKIIKLAVTRLPEKRTCECAIALKPGFATTTEMISAEYKKKYNLLISKYIV